MVMGVVFALIWSSAFTVGHVLVSHGPPLMVLSVRFMVAGTIGVLVAFAMGERIAFTRPQWRAIWVFGFFQNAIYLGANFVAMQRVDASLAAIVGSTMPLLVALSGWLFRGERLSPLGFAGLGAGMAGVAVIMAGRLSGGVDMPGLLMLCVGAVALTTATLAVRTASGGNMLMAVALQMLVGAAVLTPLSLLIETWEVDLVPRFALAFVYIVLIASLAATWLWFGLVRRIGAVRAATFHFLNPAFGVGIAALLLGEAIHPADMAGVAIIAAGILAVQFARQQGARDAVKR